MKKFSRKYGWMWLSSYVPGDGCIDFVWVPDSDKNGECLSETVTESDISEWLRIPENGKRFKNWDIITLGRAAERHFPANVRLVHLVARPFHTSCKLLLDDKEYEYHHDGIAEDSEEMHYHSGNTDFYSYDSSSGRGKYKVRNPDVISALCYFLNHEKEFERSGLATRETVQR